MKTLTRRVSITAAGIFLAAVSTATPASAYGQATGTFFYQALLTGSGTITNPIYGNCYSLGTFAGGGNNFTDAMATVYTDGACGLFGMDVNPGDNVTQALFGSVVFREIA